MSALVSILIPVYNRVSLVGETIESARNQTYQNIEIIIVDNCSTDGTWSVLKNFSKKDCRIRIFQNAENIGPVLNWKRCINEARGIYAKILFSDDLVSENFVENSLSVFEKDVAACFTIISIWNNIFAMLLNGLSKTRVLIITAIFGMLINIPISIYLAKIYGSAGVIMATCISLSFFAVFGALESFSIIKKNYNE